MSALIFLFGFVCGYFTFILSVTLFGRNGEKRKAPETKEDESDG